MKATRNTFAAALRDRNIPFCKVDEAKKAIFHDAEIESFDYLIHSQAGDNLLVIVRPGLLAVTEDDVAMLAEWEAVFGKGFAGAVFVGVKTFLGITLAEWRAGSRALQPLEEMLVCSSPAVASDLKSEACGLMPSGGQS